MSGRSFALLFSGILLLAAWLRLPALRERPMHTDEAVHAAKLDLLLQSGRYVYDPHEYHGPTLYYFTLPLARCSAARSIAQLDEAALRVVPAMFCLGTLCLTLLLTLELGRVATLVAVGLYSVSPASSYYACYYIHESLLVFFSFALIACVWRWLRDGHWAWCAAGGLALGCLHATKETCLIVIASMAAACAITRWLPGGAAAVFPARTRSAALRDVCIGLALAAVVSVTLFSAFFSHARGPWDSIATYFHYLQRADGDGAHAHPWYYYLALLTWTYDAPGPIWTEAPLLLTGLAGAALSLWRFTPRADAGALLARFMALYTLLLIACYAAIPYKTPWCSLGFLHGLSLLAGVALARVVQRPDWKIRTLATAALLAAGTHLGLLARASNTRFAADPRNPYAYAHALGGVRDLGAWVERLAREYQRTAPGGPPLLVQVLAHDPWPLPWYLRRLERVGYWAHADELRPAPLLVVFPELALEAAHLPEAGYLEFVYSLRPDVRASVWVERGLYEAFVLSEQEAAP